MVDWSKGYSASFYAELVDPATWRDVGVIEITGGMIKREPTGKRQSADIDCVNYRIDVERWIRVYMDVEQAGSSAHVPLFTGLATSPDDAIDGSRISNKLSCYSVLQPAADVILQRGWYAMAGSSGGELIRQLLAVTPAPVVVSDESPLLSETIIAEDKETHLSMADKIMAAIGWRLRIDGDGTIYVLPRAVEAAAEFNPLDNDAIEPEIKVTQDWYSCPNVYMAISGDMTGIARDDDPDSPLSTINRGREVWAYETGCALADNETIAEYAMRMLRASQQARQVVRYQRRYVPGVLPGDLIAMRYPEQGLKGLYEVGSQSITLGHCARTSEEISKER